MSSVKIILCPPLKIFFVYLLPLLTSVIVNLSHLHFTCPNNLNLALLILSSTGGNSHLASHNFVSNHISPSMSTHPSMHPHFLDINLPHMGVLDLPTLCPNKQSWVNHHCVELTFNLVDTFLSHGIADASLYLTRLAIMQCATSLSIFLYPWVLDLRLLKLSLLDMTCAWSSLPPHLPDVLCC